jgi:hypothetical protein
METSGSRNGWKTGVDQTAGLVEDSLLPMSSNRKKSSLEYVPISLLPWNGIAKKDLAHFPKPRKALGRFVIITAGRFEPLSRFPETSPTHPVHLFPDPRFS